MSGPERILIRPFQFDDLAVLVAFWNNAFADRRNFYPLTAADFQNRILNCAAFDPQGLILAWQEGQATRSQDSSAQSSGAQLVGIAHALRPAPRSGLYTKWEARHSLALLYVDPVYRNQGIGSRLLRTAENWLYYCPVHVGGAAAPCYGTVEGPRPPFFGSSQRLGVGFQDRLLIHFLTNRGYHIVDPGDISMRLNLTPQPEPELPDLEAIGLRLVPVSHLTPFVGQEPEGREEYTLWGDNGGEPYMGYVLVNDENLLQAHISWYPMRQPGAAAIAGFWVSPRLRGHGLGRYLLDRALYDLIHSQPPWGGYDTVEVQTHLIHHAQAAALYERRGFITEMAWVNLAKECAVRGVQSTENVSILTEQSSLRQDSIALSQEDGI
jgi:GNAT superfamily N-acetyltransferase